MCLVKNVNWSNPVLVDEMLSTVRFVLLLFFASQLLTSVSRPLDMSNDNRVFLRGSAPNSRAGKLEGESA